MFSFGARLASQLFLLYTLHAYMHMYALIKAGKIARIKGKGDTYNGRGIHDQLSVRCA
jgi:hypothetical protein